MDLHGFLFLVAEYKVLFHRLDILQIRVKFLFHSMLLI